MMKNDIRILRNVMIALGVVAVAISIIISVMAEGYQG